MQNSAYLTRITSLYLYQFSPPLYSCKTAWFASVWQVYMGSSPHQCFFSRKTATLGPYLQVCIGPRPHLWFCTCKTATLELELQVSVGPRPHMWFLHAKQRLLDQNNKSLWVPDKSVLSNRTTSLYGSQHSSVAFACKTATFGPELQASVCTRPHLSFCACKSAWLAPELLVSMGSSPHLWFLQAKQRVLYPNNESLWVPDLTSHFVLAKQRD